MNRISNHREDLAWRETSGQSYIEAHKASCRDRIMAAVSGAKAVPTREQRYALARRRRAEMRGTPTPRPSLRAIIAPIAAAEGLLPQEVSFPSRQRHYFRARREAAIAIHTVMPDMPLAEIARVLGYAQCRSVARLLDGAGVRAPKSPGRPRIPKITDGAGRGGVPMVTTVTLPHAPVLESAP